MDKSEEPADPVARNRRIVHRGLRRRRSESGRQVGQRRSCGSRCIRTTERAGTPLRLICLEATALGNFICEVPTGGKGPECEREYVTLYASMANAWWDATAKGYWSLRLQAHVGSHVFPSLLKVGDENCVYIDGKLNSAMMFRRDHIHIHIRRACVQGAGFSERRDDGRDVHPSHGSLH